MEKPEIIESYEPHSGHYSWRKDLRLNAWLAVATATYAAMLWVVKHHPGWSPLTRGLLNLAPLPPSLLYLHSWMKMVRALDELQRRIQMEAFLFAALGTVFIGVILSTLNASGIMPFGDLQGPGLGFGTAFFTMFTLWLVGTGLANRRYQ